LSGLAVELCIGADDSRRERPVKRERTAALSFSALRAVARLAKEAAQKARQMAVVSFKAL
jgi:hypothetical protein